MRIHGAALALALLALLVPATAGGTGAAEIEIKQSYFKYGGKRYFRGAADQVQLGSYGEKKSPLVGTNRLAVYDDIPASVLAAHGQVEVVGPVPINWTKYKKLDLEANGQVMAYSFGAEVAVGYTRQQLKTANMKLIKLYMDEGPVKKVLNNATAARNYLKNEGGDGRVVHEIWVVMEAQLATHFQSSGGFLVSGNAAISDNLEISATVGAGGSGGGSQTIVLAPGTTFAYAMMKVKKWNSGKTRVRDLEDDLQGLQ